jgi:hypothetical protein
MNNDLPPELINYLSARDHERGQKIDAVLATLSPREQVLVREAAVMGYVQGSMAPKAAGIPFDTAILRGVVAACLAMPDRYPNLSSASA